jgi:hypothetical protein
MLSERHAGFVNLPAAAGRREIVHPVRNALLACLRYPVDVFAAPFAFT